MSTIKNGPVAVTNLPKPNKALIVYARAVYDHLFDNTKLPDPHPPLSQYKAEIDAFDDAEIKVAGGGKGMAKQRDAKKKKVKKSIFGLRDYVQSVADTMADPADAASVIASAFMGIKKTPVQSKAPLTARNTTVSREVALVAKAVKRRAIYYWQYSDDGVTWQSAPETLRARTVISGLTSARTYHFRFRAVSSTGDSGFSQVVTLLVH